MRGLGPTHHIAAAAVVVLLATACGGGGSGGLATLVDTSTTAPAIDPDDVEPVSEPTAVTQSASETPETIEPVSSVEVDQAGTGTAETTGAVATDEPEDLTDEERLLAFAECMRQHGVDFPDPVVEADGTVTFGFRPGGGAGQGAGNIRANPDLPAAREACGDLLEGLAFGPGSGNFDQTELQDTLLEFAQCMRDNGIDMGDPDLRDFGPGNDDEPQPGRPFGGIDFDDPDVAAAFEVCQQQAPLAGRGRGLGGSG